MTGGGEGQGVSTESQGVQSIRKKKEIIIIITIIKKTLYYLHDRIFTKKNKGKNNFPTQSNADFVPLTAFQQTVPDVIPAISSVKKDS